MALKLSAKPSNAHERGAARMRRGGARRRLRTRGAGALLVALIIGSPLAGCVSDEALELDGLTLIAAHEAALPRALRLDGGASFAGFAARQAEAALAGDPWLLDHVQDVPPGGSGLASGRSDHWVLLYVTPQGRTMRAHVTTAPQGVAVDWVGASGDAVAQALWALNLGGRLVVDSPAALAAARDDPYVRSHLRAHPEAPLAVAAAVTKIDAEGTRDMAYGFYWGPADAAAAAPFSVFAHVHHYTGRVAAVGDAAAHQRERVAVLVDETFAMGPVPLEAFAERDLAVRVTEARLFLRSEGAGRFVLRLLHENTTEAVRVEEVVVLGPEDYEREIGVMETGRWVLHLEVQGRLEFALRIEGKVPVAG
jgi:hypothetical protein